MTSTYDGDPPLTDEQQAVVDLPAESLTLVTAGPGAGKTHTLVRRIEHLIQRDRLGAGEILVLTFSRAAVRELKKRLVGHGENGRYVRVQTFDTWALELLLTVDAHGEWQQKRFDDRIDGATKWIDAEAVNMLLEDLKHVVIDEVQDLVGCRRRMVQRLLETYECGFTVVGDSAQSIYGFQVAQATERAKETNEFARWVRKEFGSDLVERNLTHNFRATTSEAQSALHLGEMLHESAASEAPENGKDLFETLWRQVKDLARLGDTSDNFVCRSLAGYDGTTAVLCPTNGQALLISEALHRNGVGHHVQRKAQDRLTPTWLATLFQVHSDSVTRAQLGEHLGSFGLADDATATWNLLMRTIRSHRRTLDLARVRAAVAEGRLPDELTAQSPADIVVSSIHRAKGLEFDRVLVVDPGALHISREDPVKLAEAARMLYVAMTRPRCELWRLENPVQPPLQLCKVANDERWGRFRLGRKSWRPGLELGAGDVFTEQPAGNNRGILNSSHFTSPATEVQDYLLDKVRSGDEVALERIPQTFQSATGPAYLVVHGPQRYPIGTTAQKFSNIATAYIGRDWARDERHWPNTIREVRIDGVETVIGSHSAGSSAGLGAHGIWLAPRLVGLSYFAYDRTNGDG